MHSRAQLFGVFLVGAILSLSMAGCGGGGAVQTVLKRAPTDLSCPDAQVTAKEIASNTVAAEGCGKKAVYNCKCTFGVGLSCTEYNCVKEAQ